MGWEQDGDHYLFGLTSTRVMRVVADGPDRRLEILTKPFPHHLRRPELHFFVLALGPSSSPELPLLASTATFCSETC